MTIGRALRGALGVALAATLGACERTERPVGELRLQSRDYTFTILPDVVPAVAREPIIYKIVVRDRETGQPIENAEGRIFASNREGASTWDGFTPGPEPGTYYGKLNFVTAGEWALAIQFRRDSTERLTRVDWMSDIRNARGEAF